METVQQLCKHGSLEFFVKLLFQKMTLNHTMALFETYLVIVSKYRQREWYGGWIKIIIEIGTVVCSMTHHGTNST